MYFIGRGVPQDYVITHMWYNLAAAKLDINSADMRDFLTETMTPAQVAEAQRLAREWKPISAPRYSTVFRRRLSRSSYA
jgi:TPR repeat protein